MIQIKKEIDYISKEEILEKVSQEQIMRYYLNVPIETTLKSPLRKENRNSASFFIGNGGDLLFSDLSIGFTGNCFHVVMRLYNLSFKEALKKIYKDMILENRAISPITTISLNKLQTNISIKKKEWSKEDKLYWTSYNLNSSILAKFFVCSCEFAFIDNKIIYSYKKDDPCYSYYFGNNKFKLYFPNRQEFRFITNTNKDIIQGFHLLPKTGDTLIITKSYKDVMVLYSLGYNSISPQSENTKIDNKVIDDLNNRFKNIYSLYDFDYAGIKGANQLRKHNIKPLFLTNGRFKTINYKAKDISDYIKENNKEQTLKLLKWLIQ